MDVWGFLIYIRKLILASITREGQNQLHPLPWLILGFFELCFLCQSHRAVGILNDFLMTTYPPKQASKINGGKGRVDFGPRG